MGASLMLSTADVQAQGILGGIGKNWSSKTKSAVIGGAIGAGAGALLSKDKKLKGAAIGAAVGAAGGYLYGRHKEKRQQTTYRYYR